MSSSRARALPACARATNPAASSGRSAEQRVRLRRRAHAWRYRRPGVRRRARSRRARPTWLDAAKGREPSFAHRSGGCGTVTPIRLGSGWGQAEEVGGGARVEIEHLGAGELSVADAVEAEDGAVETVAGGIEASLVPKHDDRVAASCDDARIEALLGARGLEGIPDFPPSWPLPARPVPVRQRRRPVKLDLRMEELALARLVVGVLLSR